MIVQKQIPLKGTSAPIPKKIYSDYAKAYPESVHKVRTRGGVKVPFPLKLFKMLESIDRSSPELAQFISWQPHGRCFRVHDLQKFREHVLPKFFNHTQYTSFRRQLNLWGFTRLRGKGDDLGAYYHEMFLRGKPFLCHGIIRTPIVGAGKSSGQAVGVTKRTKKAEPEFCSMPPMPSRAEMMANVNEPEVDLESDDAASDIEMDNFEPSIAEACNNDQLSLVLAGRTLNSEHFDEAFLSLLQDTPSSLLLPLPAITLEMLEVRPVTAIPVQENHVECNTSNSSCDTLVVSTEEDSIMKDQDPCNYCTSNDTPVEYPTMNYQDPCNDDNIACGRDDTHASSSSLYDNLTPFEGDPPPITQDEWEQIRELVSRIN